MKDITVLRNHLFEQLNRLADASSEELESEITRAASIVQVADSIIRTAQTENQFISITKAIGSGFIPITSEQKQLSQANAENISIKKKEMFDPDAEENWLTAEQGRVTSPSNNGIEPASFSAGKTTHHNSD